MLFPPMIINVPFFLIMLFHSTYSNTNGPIRIFDEDPCIVCTKVSDKFVEGYKKTSRSGFGGGNTDWEEKKLKDYAKSETRLIEIMEKACGPTDTQCSTFLERYEDDIEEWYQRTPPHKINTFHEWLCIDTVQFCCPKGTFGPNCRRCHRGDNKKVCSGNGNCHGDGSRFGNGRCECVRGHGGTNCSNCQSGYIKSIDEGNEVICTDIDECHSNILLSPCIFYKCNNTGGGYECYGQPFYHELPKVSTLAVLLLTVSILMYKELYTLASVTCLMTSVILILFAKNLL